MSNEPLSVSTLLAEEINRLVEAKQRQSALPEESAAPGATVFMPGVIAVPVATNEPQEVVAIQEAATDLTAMRQHYYTLMQGLESAQKSYIERMCSWEKFVREKIDDEVMEQYPAMVEHLRNIHMKALTPRQNNWASLVMLEVLGLSDEGLEGDVED